MPEATQLTEPRPGRPIGGRVAVVYSAQYGVRLGGLERMHPFDIRKYGRIYRGLDEDGVVSVEDVYVPGELSEEEIRSVHSAAFLRSLDHPRTVATYLEAPMVGVLPRAAMEKGILRPFRVASKGTVIAAREALEHGVGINIGGGYHHAKPDRGEGFCVYADIPIAIRLLQREGAIERALVIDLDVHQGNGTIVCQKVVPGIFTFSMHQDDIYPIPKEKGDRDIGLAPGTADERFLAILGEEFPAMFEASRPDIVFIVAGCDTLVGDALASLAMTPEGVVARDLMAVEACLERGIPAVVTLGGGYSKDAWRTQYLSIKSIIERAGDTR